MPVVAIVTLIGVGSLAAALFGYLLRIALLLRRVGGALEVIIEKDLASLAPSAPELGSVLDGITTEVKALEADLRT